MYKKTFYTQNIYILKIYYIIFYSTTDIYKKKLL